MTTTPTIWKPAFTLAPTSQLGNQTLPQSIGLANGNFLIVWEDDTDPTRPFTDIIGQMFSAEGVALGPAFQVNAAIWGSDETGPKIAALPDGGFVMAYGGYFESIGGFITVERFNSSGQSLFSNIITDPLSSLTDWELSVDGAGNYTVVFERLVGISLLQIDIRSITYDGQTNARGPERIDSAQNSLESDRLGATAAYADGRLVTFYTEPDDWLFSVFPPLWVVGTTFEFTITNPLTGAVIRHATEIADPETRAAGRAQDVAVLTGGQIVLLYSHSGTNSGLGMKIVADGSASGSISAEIVVDAGFSLDGYGVRGLDNARVVALQDGGFLLAWVNGVFLYASRHDASGSPVGSRMVADQQVATGQAALFDLSLTTDGRVLIPFIRNNGEVAEVILDPRDTVIFGTEASDVITTQITSTQIFGLGGTDTILGQGGNDIINGGLGLDFLHGGGGNDTFHLNDMTRLGQISTYIFYDEVIERANRGFDTIYIEPLSALVNYYTLPANVERGIVNGANAFDLTGNALANTLIGNAGINLLRGHDGDDSLFGGFGADRLAGGSGNDALSGDAGNDILFGGDGNDRLTGGGDIDRLLGGSGTDRLEGGPGNDLFLFTALSDSEPGALRDRIVDFAVNPAAGPAFADRLSVAAIDASQSLAGDQAFAFVGAAAFAGEGQIRAVQAGLHTILQFNTAGAGGAEMEILLANFASATLTASDFVL